MAHFKSGDYVKLCGAEIERHRAMGMFGVDEFELGVVVHYSSINNQVVWVLWCRRMYSCHDAKHLIRLNNVFEVHKEVLKVALADHVESREEFQTTTESTRWFVKKFKVIPKSVLSQ